MRDESFPPPIFLLAPPRSFTSVVCGVIGQHPQLLGSPELNLFRARTMRKFISLTGLHMGLHRFVAHVYAGEQTIESIEMARHWVLARRDRTTAEVHRELCAKIAPRALVQKSPRYMRRLVYMQGMLDAFPRARFIHLVRHPRGMSESYMKMHDMALQQLACLECGAVDRSGPQPIADPQILWHDYNLRILRFQEKVHPDRWLRINGEHFLADIDNQLHRLCDWLGISTAPDAIAAMKRPEDSPFACFGPINALVGNDPNFLRDPYLRPYKVKEQSLDGTLTWRADGGGFHPRVVEMAQSFGYT
jgi:Sulfotransferase family